jgi:hypothetical protein
MSFQSLTPTTLGRNEAFLKNASDYAGAVVVSAEILRLFPEWTKKFVKIVASRNRKGLADSITNLSFIVQILPVMKYRKAGERMLKDFIQARLDGLVDEQGKSPEDLVQWLADAAPPVEKTVPQLAERVMALNVASIHTTTMVRLVIPNRKIAADLDSVDRRSPGHSTRLRKGLTNTHLSFVKRSWRILKTAKSPMRL